MEAQPIACELFTEAVKAVLETWPVLQIAVDNGFGGVYGQQKADWMVNVVQQYFHDNANLQQYEVEEYIADLMDNEFDTVVDDGSLPQLAQNICQIFTQCQQGKLADVKDLIARMNLKKSAERATVTLQISTAVVESEEEETESMECETTMSTNASSTSPKQNEQPTPPSQEENDGWTVVRRK